MTREKKKEKDDSWCKMILFRFLTILQLKSKTNDLGFVSVQCNILIKYNLAWNVVL